MVGDPGAIPTGIISGHFNDDPFLDLAIANTGSFSNDFVLFLGKGDGTFTEGERYKTGMSPIGLISADFNGDKRPDVLVLNGLGDSLTLFLHNEGDGFTKLRDFAAEGAPLSAAAADFDRDGVLDLAVANNRSHNISFLAAKGGGLFSHPPRNFITGKSPFSVLTEDFNQDGNPDLAVVNQDDHTLSIILGKLDLERQVNKE
jgi:hypothetical protein